MPERVPNQNQHFVEKAVHVFGPSETSLDDVKVVTMPITNQSFRSGNESNNAERYYAQEDILETLPDGRTIKLLGKGQSVPMAEAVRRGFVKTEPEKKIGPTEKKPGRGPKESK